MRQTEIRHPRPGPPGKRRRARRGFSMLEMMVVLGIMLLLMVLGVAGYRTLDRAAALRATHAALGNAQGLVTELEANGGLSRLEGPSGTNPTPPYATGATFDNPGDVNIGMGGRTTAVANCQQALARLAAIPKNRQALAGLPSKMIVTNPVNTYTTLPPAIADGWTNPILFVPSGGLTGVTVGSQTVTITSPDHRPFWASAGPDGIFSTGDDNVYSFEK